MSNLIIALIVTAVALATTFVLRLPPENPVEEIAEKIVEEEIGIKIDFTPSTPER